MKASRGALFAAVLCFSGWSWGQDAPPVHFEAVPELPYRVQPDFFELPNGLNFGEVSAVAVNSKGHIFLFQRVKPMLAEFDTNGHFLRSLGEGLFDTPHGLRIDAEDNIWTTDVGSHTVLKLNPAGRLQMVLGRKGQGAEADWLFNRPADVAFDKQGNIYIADGYGNSRIMKFDKTGRFLKSWGSFGNAPGEFELPHAVVIDKEGKVYVGDRERIIASRSSTRTESFLSSGQMWGIPTAWRSARTEISTWPTAGTTAWWRSTRKARSLARSASLDTLRASSHGRTSSPWERIKGSMSPTS